MAVSDRRQWQERGDHDAISYNIGVGKLEDTLAVTAPVAITRKNHGPPEGDSDEDQEDRDPTITSSEFEADAVSWALRFSSAKRHGNPDAMWTLLSDAAERLLGAAGQGRLRSTVPVITRKRETTSRSDVK